MKRYLAIIVVLLFCMIFTSHVKGQGNTQNHEIGFRTYNLDNFGIVYKKQKTDNTYSRIRLATGEIEIGKLSSFIGSFELGVAGGQETRRSISEKLDFVNGFELMGTLRTALVGDKPSISFTPGIGVVLGFSYLASEKFIIGIETIPSASFKFGYNNKKASLTNIKIRFASTPAILFVAYRFSK